MRVFGPFSLDRNTALGAAFAETTGRSQAIAASVFAHCQQSVTTALSLENALRQVRSTRLYSKTAATAGDIFKDSLGAAFDLTSNNFHNFDALDAANEFVSRVQAYWSNHGSPVNVLQVQDAYQVSSPDFDGVTKRDNLQFQQVCRRLVDLRSALTNDVPAIRDEWFNC